jgi:hypothetical protein
MASLTRVRKIKTKKITFRLSLRQKMIVDKYCNAYDLTTNKFIKKAMKEYLLKNYDLDDDSYVSKNQLTLFDFEDEAIEQEEQEMYESRQDQLQMALAL